LLPFGSEWELWLAAAAQNHESTLFYILLSPGKKQNSKFKAQHPLHLGSHTIIKLKEKSKWELQ
jgi:hypothetical protein